MKVLYSGICGTDKHTYRGESKQYAGTDHEREIVYPLICGHENVGVIALDSGRVACDGDPETFLAWASVESPTLQTPAAKLFALAGLHPPPAGVRQARSALRRAPG